MIGIIGYLLRLTDTWSEVTGSMKSLRFDGRNQGEHQDMNIPATYGLTRLFFLERTIRY